jgi:SAM-dependent methyltransferase
MDQITTGIRSVLSLPIVYDTFQTVVGAVASKRRVCEQYVSRGSADVVVDVGCGTADLLRFLPSESRYFGFDLSERYIEAAKKRHAGRPNCSFLCADLNEIAPDAMPPCDLAIVFGVLHHINDDSAIKLMESLFDRLAPGGRLITVDPTLAEGQSPVARELIKRDRGQHVRTPSAYESLVPSCFLDHVTEVRHDMLYIPYSLAVTVSTKPV